jgi:hypothetical protein
MPSGHPRHSTAQDHLPSARPLGLLPFDVEAVCGSEAVAS